MNSACNSPNRQRLINKDQRKHTLSLPLPGLVLNNPLTAIAKKNSVGMFSNRYRLKPQQFTGAGAESFFAGLEFLY